MYNVRRIQFIKKGTEDQNVLCNYLHTDISLSIY